MVGGVGCLLLRGGKCKFIEEVIEGIKRFFVDWFRMWCVYLDFMCCDRC